MKIKQTQGHGEPHAAFNVLIINNIVTKIVEPYTTETIGLRWPNPRCKARFANDPAIFFSRADVIERSFAHISFFCAIWLCTNFPLLPKRQGPMLGYVFALLLFKILADTNVRLSSSFSYHKTVSYNIIAYTQRTYQELLG